MRRYNRGYNADPRIITAKFDSKCAETGKLLKKGEEVLYYPADKTVYSLDSKQAKEFRDWQADLAMGYNY